MTQRELILQELRRAGDAGVCITDLGRVDQTVVLTARNRISELRRDHVAIESEPCHVHKHRSSVSRYRLAQVGQRSLAL